MLRALRSLSPLARKPLIPRVFPATGFQLLESSIPLEEETWEWYKPEEFYPVKIGEVLNEQYQVVGKLGFGSHGTAWLARDLRRHVFVAIKIGTVHALSSELLALRRLKSIKTKHAGSLLVRQHLDDFELSNRHGGFQCLVHRPQAITLRDFRQLLPSRMIPVNLLKLVLQHLLLALDFLHTEAKLIHTDIQEKNILLGLAEETSERDLEDFEKAELETPSARKISGERTIYVSRRLVPPIYSYGRPVLCDFGEARNIEDYDNLADIQPYSYRAPEVIFEIPWDRSVDIWNVGVMIWDTFQPQSLFRTTGGPEGKEDNIYHLAHMIALLGPPPLDFLQRTKGARIWDWFDRNGNWTGKTAIPHASLEVAEKMLSKSEKAAFLTFVRRMLKWRPEERDSARDLLNDPWLKI
ncbi:kinase-like protein [Atractiella rhizophila]|nr:kinase-like protein [Atractiella rhizophila]